MKAELKYWQKEMGFDGWDMTVEIVEEGSIEGFDQNDWVGESVWDTEEKTAHICLTEESESKLVHELVHILFNPTSVLANYLPSEAKLALNLAEELVVERVSQVLYSNSRGK